MTSCKRPLLPWASTKCDVFQIVDEQRRLVGIITQVDVATRAGHDKQTGEVVEQISKSSATGK